MNQKKIDYFTCDIQKNEQVCGEVYKLTLKGSFKGTPGQFYMIKGWGKEPILPRPISIHHIDEEKIEFLYQVVGSGTEALAQLKENEKVELTGPLGNGFELDKINGKVAIVTGGIGIAPMLYVAENLKHCSIDFYCGFRNEVYAIEGFENIVDKINIATESGKVGHKGYVTEAFQPSKYDVVLCCGPEIMMEKVIHMCRAENVPIYVSMEKHMACGIGACLVCTCKTKQGNKRTCKDGPVFLGDDVIV